MAFTFQNSLVTFTLKEKNKIKTWLNQIILKQQKKAGEINYVFTSDAELLKYNQNYLNHNTLTDIITFDNSEWPLIAGDIIISIERVKENAQKFGVTFDNELQRVMAHGLLHLLGYKDKAKKDVVEMRKQEALALNLLKKISD